MTGPEGTRAQPAVEPSVSTSPAPGRPHGWWSTIPAHLGRARTSTVVLALLFLAVGALYLTVRPDPVGTATTGGSSVTTPAQRTGGGTGPTSEPSTAAPTAPTTTKAPTPEAPTTTGSTTPSDLPTTSTLPEETTDSVPTTTDETTTEAPLPTSETESPTG
jgi:hypothetical protein